MPLKTFVFTTSLCVVIDAVCRIDANLEQVDVNHMFQPPFKTELGVNAFMHCDAGVDKSSEDIPIPPSEGNICFSFF